jgi:hypothetical protein
MPTCEGVRPVSKQARAGEQTGVGGVGGEVGALAGVGAQVKEVVRAVRVAPDQLVVRRADHAQVAVFAADGVAPVGRRRVLGQRAVAATGVLGGRSGARRVHPGPVADGLEAVVVVHATRHHVVGGDFARQAQDQRHLDRDLVHIERAGAVALAPEAVVAERQAVVRCVDDQGAVEPPLIVQPLQEAGGVAVHVGHGGVVVGVAAA